MHLSKKKKRVTLALRQIGNETMRLQRILTKYGYRSNYNQLKPRKEEERIILGYLQDLRRINKRLDFFLFLMGDLTRDPRFESDSNLPF